MSVEAIGRSPLEALHLIARDGGANWCEHTVDTYNGKPCRSVCRHPDSGRTPNAEYGADRWCHPCIAADALGLPLHAADLARRSTSDEGAMP